MYQEKQYSRREALKKIGFGAAAMGLTSLLNCSKKETSSDSLENSVEDGLDLSTPEKALESYIQAWNDKDLGTLIKITSRQSTGGELSYEELLVASKDLNTHKEALEWHFWAKNKWNHIPLDYSISKIEKINEKKVIVHTKWEGKEKTIPLTFSYEDGGWKHIYG